MRHVVEMFAHTLNHAPNVKSVNGELQAVLQRVVVEHFFTPCKRGPSVKQKIMFVMEATKTFCATRENLANKYIFFQDPFHDTNKK
jgi:hypothetical protein